MDWLNDREFYEAMQGYRCAPMTDQREVIANFENVKRLIRERSQAVEAWQQQGEALLAQGGFSVMFSLGAWWADRPWRKETP